MFGIEYLWALIRVLFRVAHAVVAAVPLRWAWNAVAPTFFTSLPPVWHHISYGHAVQLILVLLLLGDMVPKLVTASAKVDKK